MQDISLTTRAGAGQALTWQQMDANWTALQVAVNALIDAGFITSNQAQTLISSAAIISALGFTPYNASNPSGFQTATQVNSAIQSVVGAAPAALDTLQLIAAQLSNDESAISALTTNLSAKASKDLSNLVALSAATIASLKTQLGVSSGGAGALTLISTKSLTGGSASWVGLNTYNRYKLIIDGFSNNCSSGQSLNVQFGYGSTPTYVTSGYQNNAIVLNGGLGRTDNYSQNSDSGLWGWLSTQDVLWSPMDFFEFDISGMTSSSQVAAMFRASGTTASNGNIESFVGHGRLATTQPTTAIQLVTSYSNGSAWTGNASLYGVAQ